MRLNSLNLMLGGDEYVHCLHINCQLDIRWIGPGSVLRYSEKDVTQRLPNHSKSKVYTGKGIEQFVFTVNGL